MNRQTQKEFDEKLTLVAERVTEICKLEKDAWLKLENFNSKELFAYGYLNLVN